MFGLGTVPDLLRLLVVPLLGWAAWRDIETRRVPNVVWYPIAGLGAVLLAVEASSRLPPAGAGDLLYLIRVAVSLGIVAPLAYVFWRLGGFGGADAKALMALALVFPTYPAYTVSGLELPLVETTLGVFSMTILTNTVILGALFPVALAVRNALSGEFSPLMFLGRRVSVSALPTRHGRLFEDTVGVTRRGLDLDALRMYLRWRGTTLNNVRTFPDAHRDPASIRETHDPTDGAVTATTDGGEVSSPAEAEAGDAVADTDAATGDTDATTGDTDAATGDTDAATADYDDPWGADAFLASIDGTAYGTTPEKLREGLELVAAREEVWISPGIPFVVPMFVGLVVALVAGDVLFGALSLLGVV